MKRSEQLRRVADNSVVWDFIVVGGGASGLGVAVDAASRGYRTVLLEAHDFAKGTSSRSTKLVHGGVRYLAQGQVGLVREALRERGHLTRNAAHLVRNMHFIVPAHRWWEKPFYRIGLGVYDLLAGSLSLGVTRTLGATETQRRLGIGTKGLHGAVAYHDGQFDDARLAIDLAKTAVDEGGIVVNHMRVKELLKSPKGNVIGVRAVDEITGISHELKGRCVVNATGVFTNEILAMNESGTKDHIVPSQGIHLVLDRSFLPGDDALMIPRTPDGRVLFAIPWYGKVVVGTTDTLVAQASLEPRPLQQEIDFVLDTAARYLARKPTRADVLSIYAGLRPLARPKREGLSTKEVSRSHKVLVAESGLLSLIGGKWTTYRRMAEDLVDRAIATAGLDPQPCRTASLPIHGNVPTNSVDRKDPMHVYGGDAALIHAIQQEGPSFKERLHPDFPFTVAEVVHAVRNEMAMTVEDVLARRVRILFLDARAAIVCAENVARIMARESGHDESWVLAQVASFQQLAQGYLPSAENDQRTSRSA